MAEEAKNVRRTAKARFTRKRNELFKSIDTDQGREMVEGNFLNLTEAWNIVEGKHDLYTLFLTDEELEREEKWIIELQDLFAEATAHKIRYIQNLITLENTAREDIIRHESKIKEREEIERKTERTLIMRENTQTVFETLYDKAIHLTKSDTTTVTSLERILKQIENAYTDCKQANNKFLELAERGEVETAIKWMGKIQYQFNEITEIITSCIVTEKKKTASRETSVPFNFQLEKIKLPRFEGEIRSYPQFKRDFEKQIMPHLRNEDICYVLRSCLGNDPANAVKSIDDNVSEMWKRLDEKYGDPAKVADIIIDSIRRTRIIREGEEKRFIEFVEIVEDGYRDLKRLGLETEITTTSSVSIIEKKLPFDVRRKWAELVSVENSSVDKSSKFPSLLKFLQSQKGAVEYDSASLRTTIASPKAVIHHTTAKEETDLKGQKPKQVRCLIHDGAKHTTEECKVYLSKNLNEKMTLQKDKGACWSCLKSGHRMQQCRTKQTCNIDNCLSQHHKSLHGIEKASPNKSTNLSNA